MNEIPSGEFCGLQGYQAIMMGASLMNRKNLALGSRVSMDPLEALRCSAPAKNSLAELEAASRSSSYKMVQLADTLMQSYYGWPRDRHRAYECYRAAAFGCQ